MRATLALRGYTLPGVRPKSARMSILARNTWIVLFVLLPMGGCVPLWETLRIERFTIAPDGTLSGVASGWNTNPPQPYKSILKPGQTIKLVLEPAAALCAEEGAASCHLEGTLVRIETSADGRTVRGLVLTVSQLSAERPGRKGDVTLSAPVGERYLAVGDIRAFQRTNVGACGFWTCIGD